MSQESAAKLPATAEGKGAAGDGAVKPRFRRIKAWALTHPGMVRDHNEDSHLCDTSLRLWAVADGMGGHLGGETASRLAVETLVDVMESLNGDASKATPQSDRISSRVRLQLLKAVALGNTRIYQQSLSDSRVAGMGTTLTAVALDGPYAHFAHVGDSRAYLLRKGMFTQLSDDHSLVNEHVKAGIMTPDQAKVSVYKNIITRSLGTDAKVAVDAWWFEVEDGDKILMCSDGLTNMLEDHEIKAILDRERPEDVPQALIDAANERGGDDNITNVLIHFQPEKPRRKKASGRKNKAKGKRR